MALLGMSKSRDDDILESLCREQLDKDTSPSMTQAIALYDQDVYQKAEPKSHQKLMDIVYWILAIGYWIFGYWILNIGRLSHAAFREKLK